MKKFGSLIVSFVAGAVAGVAAFEAYNHFKIKDDMLAGQLDDDSYEDDDDFYDDDDDFYDDESSEASSSDDVEADPDEPVDTEGESEDSKEG